MTLSRCLKIFITALFPLGIGGCGMYTPLLEPGQEPHLTGILANRIVGHVKCELGRAILAEVNYDKENAAQNHTKRRYPWLDNWAGTLTLTMQVDERSSLAPGVTWTDPLPRAQSFTLGAGVAASADATRKQQVDYVFNVQNDFIHGGIPGQYDEPTKRCQDEDGRVLIEGDLQIKDWLDSALFPFDTSIPDAKVPDVLTDDLTFVVSFNGNVTPSWKLVRVSVDPSSPLFSATRTRTNEALIALGPSKSTTSGKSAPGPSQTVIDFRNISLIGSALNVSLKTP
jgi:hypothetical protein